MKEKREEKNAKGLHFTPTELASIYQMIKEYHETAPDDEEEIYADYDEYSEVIGKTVIQSILKKIIKQLPKDEMNRINKDSLRKKYRTFNNEIDENVYTILEKAFKQLKRVEIEYFNMENAEFVKRPIDIYYISRRYTIGHCHMRKDMRKFRTSRIASAKIMNNAYTIPKTFNKSDY